MESGILLIRKKEGISSYDVIRYLKRKFSFDSIGHAGTLDPFASGLLIIGINEGTKLLPFLESSQKEYIGKITLGKETDTLDRTGKIIKESKINYHDKFEVLDVLNSFLGEYSQIPPSYSAIKINGKPSYKYARNGIKIELKPKIRYINKINLINLTSNSITFYVNCSKGTYIRVLAKDISTKLGELGYLENLSRISIGKYHIRESIKMENVTLTDILPLIDATPYKKVKIDDLNKIKDGKPIKLDKEIEKRISLINNNKLIAIYEYDNNRNLYISKRGFN